MNNTIAAFIAMACLVIIMTVSIVVATIPTNKRGDSMPDIIMRNVIHDKHMWVTNQDATYFVHHPKCHTCK